MGNPPVRVRYEGRRAKTFQFGFEYPDIEDDYLANNGDITEIPVEPKHGRTDGN